MRSEPVEVLFALISIAGVIFSLLNVIGSRKDLATFRLAKANGIGEIILKAALKTEIARLIGFILLSLVGVWASLEGQISQPTGHIPYRIAAAIGLLAAQLIWFYNTFVAWRLRVRMRSQRLHPDGQSKEHRLSAFKSFEKYRQKAFKKSEEAEREVFEEAEEEIEKEEEGS